MENSKLCKKQENHCRECNKKCCYTLAIITRKHGLNHEAVVHRGEEFSCPATTVKSSTQICNNPTKISGKASKKDSKNTIPMKPKLSTMVYCTP
jgi:hypothetical protein